MLSFFVLLLFLPKVIADCPSGSVYYSQLSKCYFFITTPTGFSDAESTCNTFGGNLASIPDSFANDFIYNQAASIFSSIDFFHIGISCTSGNCSWTDGSPFTYNDFITSSNLDGCGTMSILNGGFWYTEGCSYQRPFVCQTSSLGTPAPSNPPSLCPSDDWYYFNETNSCYYWTNSSDWASLEAFCAGLGAHLASIHSKNEFDFLKFIYNGDIWIGLHTDDNPVQFNSLWQWTDGSYLDYLPWYGSYGPILGADRQCGSVYSRLATFWNSACNPSDTNLTGICKKPSSKIVTTINPPPIPKCPTGWTYYKGTDFCYLGPTNVMTQNEAEKYCTSVNGHISSIHSDDEFQLLLYATSSANAWTGLYTTENPIQLNTTWKWTDNTSVDYIAWYAGIPSLDDQLCTITMRNCSSGRCTNLFQNVDCSGSYPAICKQSSINTLSSTSNPLSTTTTRKPPSPCDNKFLFSNNYFIPLAMMNWTTAEEYCELCGGYLASIHSSNELLNIVDKVFTKGPLQYDYGYYWTGLYTENGGRTWKWNDGSFYDYSSWLSGYPRLGKSNCANLEIDKSYNSYNGYGDYGLNNEQDCSQSLYGICKYR